MGTGRRRSAEAAGDRSSGGRKSVEKWWKDPEAKRKRRVAKYKLYAVEGKVKRSINKGFKWVKNRNSLKLSQKPHNLTIQIYSTLESEIKNLVVHAYCMDKKEAKNSQSLIFSSKVFSKLAYKIEGQRDFSVVTQLCYLCKLR